MSQERLAADASVDRAYISGLERGQGNPTVDLLDRLAQVLGVKVGEFLAPRPAGATDINPLGAGRKRRQ